MAGIDEQYDVEDLWQTCGHQPTFENTWTLSKRKRGQENVKDARIY